MIEVNIPIKINFIGTAEYPDDELIICGIHTDKDGGIVLDVSFRSKSSWVEVEENVEDSLGTH